MRRLGLILLLVFVAAAGAFWLLTRPGSVTAAEVADLTGDPGAGEAVFWAGGCAGCHAAEDATGEARLILAGGRMLASPYGSFAVPNISPDPEQGIGGWTLADFITAMQEGVSPEGRHHYPAFPYPAYRLATRQDLADLFAFLGTLPADPTPSAAHDLAFPATIRRGVGLWNLLHLPDGFTITTALDNEAERGRYLAEALGHCGECHTPRDATGGLDRTRWLQGAENPTGDGRIPALTPDALGWSAAEITAYLTDGFTPSFDVAAGQMAEVIQSLSMLPEADRAAIAAYLLALPPSGGPEGEAPITY